MELVGLNVTSVLLHFILNVQLKNLKLVFEQSASFVHSFVAGNFKVDLDLSYLTRLKVPCGFVY